MADEGDPDRSITADGYDRLVDEADRVERWASPWADSPYQEHYVWPAARSLLPDVAELNVLDAGCGVGHYAEWFLDNGASVVGVDISAEALEVARDRCGAGATFYRRDLTEPLEFASDDTFDLVFSNLVLDHVAEWEPVFEKFARILVPGGRLVFTTIHPLRRYLNHRQELSSYYETEGYVVEWGNTDAEIVSYYRPIGDVIGSLANAGFAVTEFREAKPRPEYREHEPERYERALERPDTLCVGARTGASPGG